MASQAEILVVAHDPDTLDQLRTHLELGDFNVRTTVDGLQGLAAVMMRAPDLIVADVKAPKMDGLGLLRSIRGNERTRSIPFVMLVGMNETPEGRQARSSGANVVLTKPVLRDSLLHAIRECLRNRPAQTLATTFSGQTLSNATMKFRTGPQQVLADVAPRIEQHTLPANFAQFIDREPTTMIGDSILDPDAELAASQTISKRNTLGTVLFSDIRNFSTMSEQLESEEVVELLNAYFARSCEPIQRQHGWVVKFLGDGLVALFESPPGHMQDHAERAVKAGLLMVLAAARFKSWIAERYPHRNLPEFSIGVGIHTGEVTVCKMGGSEAVETTMIGDNVNIAARLEEKTKEVGWSVIASQAAFEAAGARILFGQRSELMVKGRIAPVGIVEVVGLQPKMSASEQEKRFYDAVTSAVATNSRTLRANHAAKHAQAVASGGAPNGGPRIPGFRLIRKLGEGGMSLVWLAQRDGPPGKEGNVPEVVLKLLPIHDEHGGEALQRFIQEYALISQIDHPNVAKIYEQGFGETHAFIAMEYFPGGDLRSLTRTGLKPDVAQAVLIQIAGALAAIHARGIIHRDMKPDNVMLRNDGSLALADFGIAKHLEMNMTRTKHGEVFGTPYYLSPEQALGAPVDRRSDIYSLGVMLYEMLAGKKPYYADNAQALLYQHVHAPVPTLPAHNARFQSLVSKMMAKRPQDRFASADEIIEAVLKL
jgi:class 3 adenylate cyclase/CheY-like chemotaxis protein